LEPSIIIHIDLPFSAQPRAHYTSKPAKMGSYTFKWLVDVKRSILLSVLTLHREHPDASEVYVTGTFDDWGKTEKLEKKGDVFEKSVHLPDKDKILYKVRNDALLATIHTQNSSP
jgi:hypothetical protein